MGNLNQMPPVHNTSHMMMINRAPLDLAVNQRGHAPQGHLPHGHVARNHASPHLGQQHQLRSVFEGSDAKKPRYDPLVNNLPPSHTTLSNQTPINHIMQNNQIAPQSVHNGSHNVLKRKLLAASQQYPVNYSTAHLPPQLASQSSVNNSPDSQRNQGYPERMGHFSSKHSEPDQSPVHATNSPLPSPSSLSSTSSQFTPSQFAKGDSKPEYDAATGHISSRPTSERVHSSPLLDHKRDSQSNDSSANSPSSVPGNYVSSPPSIATSQVVTPPLPSPPSNPKSPCKSDTGETEEPPKECVFRPYLKYADYKLKKKRLRDLEKTDAGSVSSSSSSVLVTSSDPSTVEG